MRGVFLLTVLLLAVFLTSCDLEPEKPDYFSISDFNKVNIIDFPYEDLDARELESLYAAYKNENKALALYRKTLDLFEGEQPFASVMLQQEFQVGLIEEVYAKYELIPTDENWYLKVTEFDNPSQACSASILFAKQSIDLYDHWLDNDNLVNIVENQDLRFLYKKIRDDYERSTIPMFKRCARNVK